jgi:hypothetical protein
MKRFPSAVITVAVAIAALAPIATPAMAQDWRYGREGYDHRDDRYGRDYDRRRGYDDDVRLRGPGVDNLDPWLRNAKRGRMFVVQVLGTHRVSERGAWIVNRELYRNRGGRDGHKDRGDRYGDRRY